MKRELQCLLLLAADVASAGIFGNFGSFGSSLSSLSGLLPGGKTAANQSESPPNFLPAGAGGVLHSQLAVGSVLNSPTSRIPQVVGSVKGSIGASLTQSISDAGSGYNVLDKQVDPSDPMVRAIAALELALRESVGLSKRSVHALLALVEAGIDVEVVSGVEILKTMTKIASSVADFHLVAVFRPLDVVDGVSDEKHVESQMEMQLRWVQRYAAVITHLHQAVNEALPLVDVIAYAGTLTACYPNADSREEFIAKLEDSSRPALLRHAVLFSTVQLVNLPAAARFVEVLHRMTAEKMDKLAALYVFMQRSENEEYDVAEDELKVFRSLYFAPARIPGLPEVMERELPPVMLLSELLLWVSYSTKPIPPLLVQQALEAATQVPVMALPGQVTVVQQFLTSFYTHMELSKRLRDYFDVGLDDTRMIEMLVRGLCTVGAESCKPVLPLMTRVAEEDTQERLMLMCAVREESSETTKSVLSDVPSIAINEDPRLVVSTDDASSFNSDQISDHFDGLSVREDDPNYIPTNAPISSGGVIIGPPALEFF